MPIETARKVAEKLARVHGTSVDIGLHGNQVFVTRNIWAENDPSNFAVFHQTIRELLPKGVGYVAEVSEDRQYLESDLSADILNARETKRKMLKITFFHQVADSRRK